MNRSYLAALRRHARLCFSTVSVTAVCLVSGTVLAAEQGGASASALPALEVHKSPTCGCCADWVTHMEKAGFDTKVSESQDMNTVKQGLGIAPSHQSCHTAVSEIDGYFFEGHVPAKFVKQFLQEKPAEAAGLSVPGMPLGSPGMEMGDRFHAYQVLKINKDGTAEVYANVSSPMEQY
jgi:hypothetical protein